MAVKWTEHGRVTEEGLSELNHWAHLHDPRPWNMGVGSHVIAALVDEVREHRAEIEDSDSADDLPTVEEVLERERTRRAAPREAWEARDVDPVDGAGVPLADDPPGMWDRSDYEGGPPDEVRGPDWPTVGHALRGNRCSCGDWEAQLGELITRGFDRHLLEVRSARD